VGFFSSGTSNEFCTCELVDCKRPPRTINGHVELVFCVARTLMKVGCGLPHSNDGLTSSLLADSKTVPSVYRCRRHGFADDGFQVDRSAAHLQPCCRWSRRQAGCGRRPAARHAWPDQVSGLNRVGRRGRPPCQTRTAAAGQQFKELVATSVRLRQARMTRNVAAVHRENVLGEVDADDGDIVCRGDGGRCRLFHDFPIRSCG